ncbi:hypothetical protein [Hyalangium versicolor]|uniref:hypothetical protein n=1 Tax=Hyalangium versicolor TaxID=2861190 RepID=UPI001CCC5457|nr:hypothetical protein [Hyalangium versicolor]
MSDENIQHVYIKTTGPSYDPDPPILKAGYKVIFEMKDWTDQVDIDFGSKSPFVSQIKDFSLNGASTTDFKKQYIIGDQADGHYPFNITPQGGSPKKHREDPTPPTIPPGDLEVTRDPPEEDQKGRK